MSEGIITGTIYETRLRDKNCCLRYGKKKKKKIRNAPCYCTSLVSKLPSRVSESISVISGCPRLSDWFSA